MENEPINDLTIIEYVKIIRNKYYPEMDIAFMDRYMSLIGDESNENKYYISSDMLATYGVLSIVNGKRNLQKIDVKKFLDGTKVLTENIDYELRRIQTSQLFEDEVNHGIKIRHVYMLTKLAFSTCLMMSTNETKYKHYYLLLEKCIYHYNKQQLIQLSNKNKTLIDRLDQLIAQGNTREREHRETMNELREVRTVLSELHKAIIDRAIPPEEKDKINSVAVMKQVKDGITYIDLVTRQTGSLLQGIKEKLKKGYIKIGEFNNVPNAIYFSHQIRSELLERKLVGKGTYRTLILNSNDITSDDLVKLMETIFENRKFV